MRGQVTLEDGGMASWSVEGVRTLPRAPFHRTRRVHFMAEALQDKDIIRAKSLVTLRPRSYITARPISVGAVIEHIVLRCDVVTPTPIVLGLSAVCSPDVPDAARLLQGWPLNETWRACAVVIDPHKLAFEEIARLAGGGPQEDHSGPPSAQLCASLSRRAILRAQFQSSVGARTSPGGTAAAPALLATACQR